ncbi:MAG: acyl-CoA dehydrogenase family protein [Pseudomonadota bacterium]
MESDELLRVVSQQAGEPVFDTDKFAASLTHETLTRETDPLRRLILAASIAGSQTNATIAGHQAAIRRLFPTTPANAITAFCVSEERGPRPRFITTALERNHEPARISGQKWWGTMAPPATHLYVAASIGERDGQNQLRMVSVAGDAPGITQIPLPPERQAGGVPICDLRFESTPVLAVFDEDAYEHYIKPFRLVEDVFSTLAMQIALYRLGAATGLDASGREDLLALIVQGHAVAHSDMQHPTEILLLTSYLRASQSHWQRLNASWSNASDALSGHWSVGREILTVAARAREQRRRNAWAASGEPLPED